MWGAPIVIIVTHFLIDLWKVNQKDDSIGYFLLDQLFHLLVLLGVWLYLTMNFSEVIPFLASVFSSEKILTILTGYLLVIFPVGFVIGKATQRWQEEIAGDEGEFPSLKKAGRYIGVLKNSSAYLYPNEQFFGHWISYCGEVYT